MFVDSDDMLVPGAIERLLNVAVRNQAEIVQGDYYELYDDNIVDLKQRRGKERCVKPALGNLQGFAWGKVFKSQLFENVVFPEGYWFEDTVLSFLVLLLSAVIDCNFLSRLLGVSSNI